MAIFYAMSHVCDGTWLSCDGYNTLRRDGWGETGLVYEDRDDVAPDLGIGDAAYAITRYRECATAQRSEPIQTIDAQ
jgi:hypothetical protein